MPERASEGLMNADAKQAHLTMRHTRVFFFQELRFQRQRPSVGVRAGLMDTCSCGIEMFRDILELVKNRAHEPLIVPAL